MTRAALQNYLKNTDGAVAIEYTIIVAAMFLALVPSIYIFRDAVADRYTAIKGFFDSLTP
jgi:Flp pilus assembly pilin Flp